MIGAQTPEYDTPIERIATPMSDEPIQEEEGLVSHKPKQKHEKAHPRDLIAFFICGLMNNFGYVIFLTAAEDLVSVIRRILNIHAFRDTQELFYCAKSYLV
jgi:hypothetical protein